MVGEIVSIALTSHSFAALIALDQKRPADWHGLKESVSPSGILCSNSTFVPRWTFLFLQITTQQSQGLHAPMRVAPHQRVSFSKKVPHRVPRGKRAAMFATDTVQVLEGQSAKVLLVKFG